MPTVVVAGEHDPLAPPARLRREVGPDPGRALRQPARRRPQPAGRGCPSEIAGLVAASREARPGYAVAMVAVIDDLAQHATTGTTPRRIFREHVARRRLEQVAAVRDGLSRPTVPADRLQLQDQSAPRAGDAGAPARLSGRDHRRATSSHGRRGSGSRPRRRSTTVPSPCSTARRANGSRSLSPTASRPSRATLGRGRPRPRRPAAAGDDRLALRRLGRGRSRPARGGRRACPPHADRGLVPCPARGLQGRELARRRRRRARAGGRARAPDRPARRRLRRRRRLDARAVRRRLRAPTRLGARARPPRCCRTAPG